MTEPGARTGLPHPDGSRAVLIGVSAYDTLDDLPAVRQNVAGLHHVLTDPELWGLAPGNCTVLVDPPSSHAVLEAVNAAAQEATEALVVYFAGHGLLDSRSDLYLAMRDSAKERLFTAIRYDDVRYQVVETGRACYGKVVILDCCYSGRALQGGMGGVAEMADHARVDGTYLMTASAETSVALAPPGEEYTAFTGTLLDKLVNGLPDGPDLLDMETLFFHVRADLQARNRPTPQQRTRNDGRSIALARNRRGHAVGAAVPPPRLRRVPPPPPGFEDFLRRRPAVLSGQVAELRASGDDVVADQLLVAVATTCVDQYLAALIGVFRSLGRQADLRSVVAAAAERPPGDVVNIVGALHATELADEAVRMLTAVAQGRADDIADVARRLREHGHSADLTVLLNAALDAALNAEPASTSLIELIGALWLVGLREEVDRLVEHAASRLPDPAVLELADQLRTAGREEAAFSLYSAAVGGLMGRAPEDIARLCRAMGDAGATEHRDRVARTIAEAATEPDVVIRLCVAFWHVGLDDLAAGLLKRAASTSPITDVVRIADELVALTRSRDAEALALCVNAVRGRPASCIAELVRSLEDAGRPLDARTVLREAVGQAPVDVVIGLLDSGLPVRQILTIAMHSKRSDSVQLVVALNQASPGLAAAALVELALGSGAERKVDVLASAVRQADDDRRTQMLTAVLDVGSAADIVGLIDALTGSETALLYLLLARSGRLSPLNPAAVLPVEAVRLSTKQVKSMTAAMPIGMLGPILGELLRRNNHDHADAVLAAASLPQQTSQTIARMFADCYGAGEPDAAARLLTVGLTGRSMHDVRDVVIELHRLGRTKAVPDVLAWVPAQHGAYAASSLSSLLNREGLHHYAEQLVPSGPSPDRPASTRRSGWLRRH